MHFVAAVCELEPQLGSDNAAAPVSGIASDADLHALLDSICSIGDSKSPDLQSLRTSSHVSIFSDSHAAAPPDSTRSSVYHLCKLDTLQSSLCEASSKPQPKMS